MYNYATLSFCLCIKPLNLKESCQALFMIVPATMLKIIPSKMLTKYYEKHKL